MKVGSQPGLKVSTWVNPSRSYRPRRFGWQSSRSLAHPCVRAAWRQASISAELTPRPACVRRTASLCRYAASPLRASGQNSGSSADKVQQPGCRRCNSRLGARISGRRSPRMSGRSARRPRRAFPWRTSTPQRRASAAQPRRYHPSRRPERSEAPRCPFAPLARYEPPPHSAV